MRMNLDFELESCKFPIESRRVALSFFKSALERDDINLFEKIFSKSESIMNDYVFSLFIPIKRIDEETIFLKNPRMNICFSTDDVSLGISFYNAFNGSLNKPLKKNDLGYKLKKISMLQEESIINPIIKVKFKTPLLVREYLGNEKMEVYLGPHDEGFERRLEEIVAAQIKILKPELSLNTSIKIKADCVKKVVIKHYGQTIDGYTGTYYLEANPAVLNYLYNSGIGSRRSQGFGMFDPI